MDLDTPMGMAPMAGTARTGATYVLPPGLLFLVSNAMLGFSAATAAFPSTALLPPVPSAMTGMLSCVAGPAAWKLDLRN